MQCFHFGRFHCPQHLPQQSKFSQHQSCMDTRTANSDTSHSHVHDSRGSGLGICHTPFPYRNSSLSNCSKWIWKHNGSYRSMLVSRLSKHRRDFFILDEAKKDYKGANDNLWLDSAPTNILMKIMPKFLFGTLQQSRWSSYIQIWMYLHFVPPIGGLLVKTWPMQGRSLTNSILCPMQIPIQHVDEHGVQSCSQTCSNRVTLGSIDDWFDEA